MHLVGGAARFPGLMAAQWRSTDEVRALQWRRLQAALRRAATQSPLYEERFRAIGATAEDIRGPDDLRRLPRTTREDLRAPDRLLCRDLDPARLRSSTTSGSTGRRTTSFFDERAWVLGKTLLKLRARLACGMRVDDRLGMFQEDAPDHAPERAWARSRTFSIHRPVEDILPAVLRFAPSVIYGFPGHLARLAEAAQGAFHPRLTFTSGELLDPATRRAIEVGLGTTVLDVYGCTEVKEVAWECPAREGYHLNADWIYVEADEADGGRLLITTLYNRAMPLLRYEVGDTGLILDRPCSCGRGLPLIRPTLGRSVDYLALPDGNRLAPYSLTCAVEAIEGMRQYQFVQTELDRIELRVVPNDDFGDASRDALHAALRPILPRVRVSIETVPSIASEPSGKFRIVQSRVNAGPPAPVGTAG